MTWGGERSCANSIASWDFAWGQCEKWPRPMEHQGTSRTRTAGSRWQQRLKRRQGDRGPSQESLNSASTTVSPPQCPGVVVSLFLLFPVSLMLWHHGTLLTLEGLPRGPANPWDSVLSNATPPNLEPTPPSPPPSTPWYYPPALITPGQVPDN